MAKRAQHVEETSASARLRRVDAEDSRRLEGRFNEDIKAAKGFLQIRGFECICAIMDKVNFAILV